MLAGLLLVNSFAFAEKDVKAADVVASNTSSSATGAEQVRQTAQQPTQSTESPEKNMVAPISKVESFLDAKGDKLPLVTQLSGNQPSIPSDMHSKTIYIEFQGSPMLTTYLKNELEKKGYQFVDDKNKAAYVFVGSGIYATKMTSAGYPRFGAPIGALVEKSGGIDKIDVDQFPEYVGKAPSATAQIDLGAVQSVANYNIGNGSSIAGGVAGGVGVAMGIDYLGEKTGLKKAVNSGFGHLVGGGNLGLDDPICFFGCDKTQTLIINLAIGVNNQVIDLIKIETTLTGTKKHMPNEILAENLKNGLSLF